MKKTIPQAPIRISRHLLLYISVFLIAFAGCHAENEIMSETDFSIEGKAYHWEGLTLHTGKILCINGKKFLLPEEVNEMHGNAWTADFNGDGKPDYLFTLASTGNGSYFGSHELFFFVSSQHGYPLFRMISHGGRVFRSGNCWLAEQILPGKDKTKWTSTFYRFTADGKMEKFVPKVSGKKSCLPDRNKTTQSNRKKQSWL